MISLSENRIFEGDDRPITIAVEGMHRSGKGTQLALMKAWLENEGLNVVRVRGAACRSGKGVGNSDYYDPVSEYWRIFTRDRASGGEDWTHAFVTIDQEVHEFVSSFGSGVILMDRCYISNGFFSERFNALSVDRPFIPDVVFYLNVSRSVLLERLGDKDDWKSRFRRNNIVGHFDEYSSHMERVIGDSENVVEVDGSLPSEEVFRVIQEDIRSRFGSVLGIRAEV